MKPDEIAELKKQLEDVTKGLDGFGENLRELSRVMTIDASVSSQLEGFGKKLDELSQKLPSKSLMEGLVEPSRVLHAQRKKALMAVIVFAGITLVWLLLLSLCSMLRPTSWEGLAIALAPALVWLGVGAIVLRWVRAIR